MFCGGRKTAPPDVDTAPRCETWKWIVNMPDSATQLNWCGGQVPDPLPPERCKGCGVEGSRLIIDPALPHRGVGDSGVDELEIIQIG